MTIAYVEIDPDPHIELLKKKRQAIEKSFFVADISPEITDVEIWAEMVAKAYKSLEDNFEQMNAGKNAGKQSLNDCQPLPKLANKDG